MTSSIKINVHVRNNGQEIGYRQHPPIRKLPDGTAGIVVNGLVYALYEDHSVDIVGEGTPKADCPEFFQPSEDLLYLDADEAGDWWFFEATRSRSYLAFDGSEAFADRLNATFEGEGLSNGCRESFRPAKNGQFYDYFIRLPSHVDEADVRRIISTVSDRGQEQDNDEASAELIRLFAEQLGGPLNFITRWTETVNIKSQLEQEIEDLRDSDLSQRQELETLTKDFHKERKAHYRVSAQIGSLEAERDRLQMELKAFKSATRDADASWNNQKSKEIDQLIKENVIIREERDLSRLEVEDLKTQVSKGLEKVESLNFELKTLRAEQQQTVILPGKPLKSSRKEKQILNDFLSGAYPRLNFQHADHKALLRDFESISDCAKVMSDLQEGRDPPHLKSWHDIDGVFEVSNIRTGIKGREKMGRIYFRKSLDGDKIDLAVHVKSGDGKQQINFVKERFR